MTRLFKGGPSMKKTLIFILNTIIIAAILIFVALYSQYTNKDVYQRQISHFENTTVSMEHVTENYLEGEQHICEVLKGAQRQRPNGR